MKPVSYNNVFQNGTSFISGYGAVPQQEITIARDTQNGASSALPSSSYTNPVPTQEFYSYPPYANSTDTSVNINAQYPNYYYGYQHPPIDSSSQKVTSSQSSGAPYQPIYSFQKSSGPTSYSGTYIAGNNQTTAGYHGNSYINQSGTHIESNSENYTFNQYPAFPTSNQNPTQNTNTLPTNSTQYQYHYDPWQNYYSHMSSNFNSNPGIDNFSATGSSTSGGPVHVVGGYMSNQPPPPGTTSWRGAAGSYTLSIQGKSEDMVHNHQGSWDYSMAGLQNQHINAAVSYPPKPNDSNFPSLNSEDQHKNSISQGFFLPPPTFNQVPEKLQSPTPTVQVVDTRRIMQVPTNPRITSSLPKNEKEGPMGNASARPAYISVPVSKTTNKNSSNQDSDSIIESQQGTLPASLRAFVVRNFSRCKDDAQRDSATKIMKEIITQASADGTLFTKNWDLEPLFPLPNTPLDKIDQKAPVRRTKSRWEPILEESLVDNVESADQVSLSKDVNQIKLSEFSSQADTRKYESKINGWNSMSFPQQNSSRRSAHRPVKQRRLIDKPKAAEKTDLSSDSDKEQDLTKHYLSAIALDDSPEEKRRRESRFRRFEKVKGHRVEAKNYSTDVHGVTKRTSSAIAKSYDSENSRAVEDIDWDALTVKGTCQEIEKRYLRLTSAPDPAAVRPDYILDKSLEMVLLSEKNYLYKCDQLKSIRQDLTVQRIQNELTVKVYEVHARLALEAGDLAEYNQCQSQLKRLYTEGMKGCYMEFSAYHLLCVMLQSNNKRELLSSMKRLSVEAKSDESVKHALAVRRAVSSGNYIKFFQLHKAAPNLNTCLMDLYVEKMRFEAVKCMSKSYRPSVPVSYINRVLGFSKKGNEDGLSECEDWLRAHGALFTSEENGELLLDTKATSSNLYMPEPDDAVAHGDASLAVDDFLTRAP